MAIQTVGCYALKLGWPRMALEELQVTASEDMGDTCEPRFFFQMMEFRLRRN